jgi:hypothetical protein
MTTDDRRSLEPIDPSSAQELYPDHKASQCSDVTVQSHEYRTNYFVTWCADNDVDNMNDLSGRDLHEYRLWRKEEGGLNESSNNGADISTISKRLLSFIVLCCGPHQSA